MMMNKQYVYLPLYYYLFVYSIHYYYNIRSQTFAVPYCAQYKETREFSDMMKSHDAKEILLCIIY